jgi:hypothetical protein
VEADLTVPDDAGDEVDDDVEDIDTEDDLYSRERSELIILPERPLVDEYVSNSSTGRIHSSVAYQKKTGDTSNMEIIDHVRRDVGFNDAPGQCRGVEIDIQPAVFQIITDDSGTDAEAERIRQALLEDARRADVVDPTENFDDQTKSMKAVTKPSLKEDKAPRVVRQKAEILQRDSKSTQPSTKARKINPLRRSQSVSLQTAILAFQQRAEMNNHPLDEVDISSGELHPLRPPSVNGSKRLDMMVEDDEGAEEEELDNGTASFNLKYKRAYSKSAIDQRSPVDVEFPSLTRKYPARYANLSILVKTEAQKIDIMKSSTHLRLDTPKSEHTSELELLTDDQLLDMCIDSVHRRMQALNQRHERPPLVSRAEMNLALKATFKRPVLKALDAPLLTIIDPVPTDKPVVREASKAIVPKPSAAFMKPTMPRREPVNLLTTITERGLELNSVSLAEHLWVSRPSGKVEVPQPAEDHKNQYRSVEISELGSGEHLTSLGMAYAALLHYNRPDEEEGETAETPMKIVSKEPCSTEDGFAKEGSFATDTESLSSAPKCSSLVIEPALAAPITKMEAPSTSLSELSQLTDKEEREMEEELRKLYATAVGEQAQQKASKWHVPQPVAPQMRSQQKSQGKLDMDMITLNGKRPGIRGKR